MSQKRAQIPRATSEMLWGKAAGRCEFSGCNKILWRSPITKETVKLGEVAHIIAFSEFGSRGNSKLSKELAKDLSNLMLLCGDCHKPIDKNKKTYPVDRLRKMKKDHEDRIEIVTEIEPEKKSDVLLYGANVGEHSSPVTFKKTTPAMLPDWYPKSTNPISLATVNSSFRDYAKDFWKIEAEHLQQIFKEQVKSRLMRNDISHLSVFAIAPQPLLMLLGYLLSDIPTAEIYQLHKEPPDWCWQDNPKNFTYDVSEPKEINKIPALVLSLSADIVDDRITSVLGNDISIWSIKTNLPDPNNDFLKSRKQLSLFRTEMRKLMNRIKKIHGEDTLLHVFPAAPVSIALDFGRVIMPKADLAMQIYDENKKLGGFIKAIRLEHGNVIY